MDTGPTEKLLVDPIGADDELIGDVPIGREPVPEGPAWQYFLSHQVYSALAVALHLDCMQLPTLGPTCGEHNAPSFTTWFSLKHVIQHPGIEKFPDEGYGAPVPEDGYAPVLMGATIELLVEIIGELDGEIGETGVLEDTAGLDDVLNG